MLRKCVNAAFQPHRQLAPSRLTADLGNLIGTGRVIYFPSARSRPDTWRNQNRTVEHEMTKSCLYSIVADHQLRCSRCSRCGEALQTMSNPSAASQRSTARSMPDSTWFSHAPVAKLRTSQWRVGDQFADGNSHADRRRELLTDRTWVFQIDDSERRTVVG